MERVLPAEIFVTPFHAGYTAFFGILLFIKFVLLSFSQYLSSLMQRYITCICLYRRKSCRKVAVIFYTSIFLMKFDIWFQKNTFYEYKKYGISCKILIFSLFCIQSPSCTFSCFSYRAIFMWKSLYSKGLRRIKRNF